MATLAALPFLSVGCTEHVAAVVPPPSYTDTEYKTNIPSYMRGTIYERTNLTNTDPYPISGYSLVVNLQNTADNSSMSNEVRQALIKRMALTGFGQHSNPLYTHVQPEDMLRDKRVAVVEVVGMLPPGARRGQRFDVIVRAIRHSSTTSLAHGHMYTTELRDRGLEQPNSGGMILAYADDGDVFVNPSYALSDLTQGSDMVQTTAGQDVPSVSRSKVVNSLHSGIVLNSGHATQDRPLFLQLRVPQVSIARRIEARVNNRFQADADHNAAAAEDEGTVALYVPMSFNGDWEHFVGVVNHLYLKDDPEFSVQKAHQLMVELHKPGAKYSELSYCLEGLGANSVAIYHELIEDPNPDVAYAAARAAAFSGDYGALEALTQMAIDPSSPYQLACVHALGALPASPSTDRRLEPLLSSGQVLVRAEAYKILAEHGDRLITTESVGDRYALDTVRCGGPSMIFATRAGTPRVAVFGKSPTLRMPIMFSAMGDRLTISSNDEQGSVSLFYRDPMAHASSAITSPDMAEIIRRLGNRSDDGSGGLDFSFADVVAILDSFNHSHRLVSMDENGQVAQASFELERGPDIAELVNAPSLEARPQGDSAAPSFKVPGDASQSAIAAPQTPDKSAASPSGGNASPAPVFGGRPSGAVSADPAVSAPMQMGGSSNQPASDSGAVVPSFSR